MLNSETTDLAPKPSWLIRKLGRRGFRWGIVFWILVWIYTVCVSQTLTLNLKDTHGMRVGYGAGSVSINIDTYGKVVFNYFRLEEIRTIKSKLISSQFKQFPEESIGLLGRIGWTQYDDIWVGFPIAGALWLWLIAGWMGDFKAIRWRNFWKNKQARQRLSILMMLPLLIAWSDHQMRVGSEFASCNIHVRNIQQAVRGYQGIKNMSTGKAIPWDDIMSPDGLLPPNYDTCPSGAKYQLSYGKPEMGVLAATCSNPEHRRKMKERVNTSTW